MKLEQVIASLDPVRIKGDTGTEITAITFDSREVKEGSLFVAIDGSAADGHTFIPRALESGAVAIVALRDPGQWPEKAVLVVVEDTRAALAIMAANWYGHPSKEIRLVGVTGTNGKTTIATLLYNTFTGLGYRAGLLSTIDMRVGSRTLPSTHTTPDPLRVNRMLREMVEEGCEYCFMEVSSHAASQKRIFGLRFDLAIFTNITHDHLDYHADFREYLEAKKSFFDMLDESAFALVNADDRNAGVMVQNSRAKVYRYGMGKLTDFHGRLLEMHVGGMQLELNGTETWVRLTGKFNASNLLAVYAAALLLGQNKEELLEVLSGQAPIRGRFETVAGASGRMGIVDYAHTDDALQNVLQTIREVSPEGSSIITVLGAGGDRDVTKRPGMGKVASLLSSKVILTSDNPRTEDPARIMEEMEAGIPSDRRDIVLKIVDREEAIKTACMMAGPGDIVLVAGKGHETVQVIGKEKHAFDDREMIKKYLKA